MVRKFSLLLVFLTVIVSITYGQMKRRHIPGRNAVSVVPGYSPDGVEVDINYLFFKPQNYTLALGITPKIGTIGQTDYTSVGIVGEVYKELFNIQRSVFVSLFVNTTAGIDYYENNALSKEDKGLSFSLGCGPEIEWFINNNYSIVTQFQQNFHLVSDFADYTYSLNLGLRYAF